MTDRVLPPNIESFNFWKNELKDAPTLIQLPTDHGRLQNQPYLGDQYSFTIGHDLHNAISNSSKPSNSDLRKVLLTTFGTLLYRYSAQDDLVINLSIENSRNQGNDAKTNILPVRFLFPEEATFAETLKLIGLKIDSAQHNSDLSYIDLFQQVHGPSRSGPTVFSNVLFQFRQEKSTTETGNCPEGSLENKEADIFDLAFRIEERDGAFICCLTYNKELYKETTIQRLAGHYTTLLRAIAEEIDSLIQLLPLLTEPEEKQILSDWNANKVDFSRDKCIHHIFEDQANKTPDAIAVVYEKEQMTYSELNEASNRVAHYLSENGACEDQIVALFLERGLQLIVGLLAISKTGATYLPLDPIYPKARLSLIVQDAKPVIFLTQKSLKDYMPETSAKTIFFDEKSAYQHFSSGNLSFGNAQKPAYILYTSGSTGKPKGVPIKQLAVVNLVHSMSKLLNFSSKDTLFAVTTISFDIAELDMYMPLFTGGKLVIAAQEATTDMYLLAEKLEESNATVFQATPVTFKMLLINSWVGKKNLKLIIGGEALSKEMVRSLLPICAGVWNSYGPTETAIYSVVRNLTFQDATGEGYVPIGRPIDNTTLYVLNKKLVPVPIGIPGELYIGGDGVSPGYLNLPNMTDERFIPDIFGSNPDEKLYKTGDLVQYFEDGNLTFLNRVDFQIKIRGFRIELGEIESAISQFPGIKDNVVIVHEDAKGDKKLTAYFIAKENVIIDLKKLQLFLSDKLPDYMVPTTFMVMKQFPVTLNGKVDRKALPAPVENAHQESSEIILPATEIEKQLAALWTEILGIKNISVTDKFFEMGGNSLSATMLISRIIRNYSIRLTLRDLFENQTIAEISLEIEQRKTIETDKGQTNVIRHLASDQKFLPLSPGQKRLWFVENFEPGNRAYNMPFEYSIKGDLDTVVLEKSIAELIWRHESLRTIITTVEGEPVQRIVEPTTFKLNVENLENLPDEERKRVAENNSDANDQHLFNLEKGPLFICKLLKYSSDNWLFLFNMHHSVTDGWSVKVFLNELGLIYTSLKNNEKASLPALPIAYTDFANWQNEWLKGEECKKELDFWILELKGAPDILQLPMDFQRPKNQTYDGDEVQFTIDGNLTEQLQQFSQKLNGSMFITLLSIFNTLISRYISQEEFLIGIPIAGRNYEERESLVGMVINNFPLRITPLENMTFPELYEQCRQKFFSAFENQELPLDRIIEELRVARTANISPLFQVMFNYLEMFDEVTSLDTAKMELVDKRRHISQYDLTLHIYETNKTLNCVLEYNTNLFKRSRIESMAGHFQQILLSLMDQPDQKLKKISLVTDQEKELILGHWNNTIVDFPKEKCIYQLFEEQVLKTPDAIAISDDKKRVTYSQLNEKANKLSRYLHRLGAVEGSLVAICIERSTDLLVCLLAIQKAGCTYIPLDPIYPKDRLALILEDGNPAILLTEKKLLDNLPETDAINVFVEEEETYLNESGENPDYKVNPGMVAYLIYTSGSTGKPKGVQIQHRALVNFLASMAKKPGITSRDVLLAVTTISFDIAGLEMYLPIICGATIFVASQETSMNPELLIRKIEENKATILQATPVTFRMLNSAEWTGSKRLKILCGGEAMPKELAFDLVQKCGELWNMYGPTETTVWSTVEKVVVDEKDKTGYINLGKPIDNTFIYVLNSEFQPVPVGYPGELFIGGDGLAKGYFNLPEMTREKFLPDPFSSRPGDRMYRTGDLVQQTDEGKLEFLNRVDSQVKIRGFRIELGEIESAMTQYPTISDNVVLVREDAPGDKKLVAYIVKRENQETDLPELRQFLRTKIPDYMVPTAFVFIDQFPLTPNGKIDRKALPAPLDSGQENTKDYIEPKTDTEKKLALIWVELLKLKRVGTDENFFEIGGHSMIAVTLMIRIEKELGIRLPLATLFDHSNIRDMAEFIDKKVEPARWGSLVPIRSKGSKPPLYLVHGAGLNLLLYTTIVSHLDPEQPVFGLQAKGLDGIDEPLNTIEGIAAYYNDEIRKIDKSGSYALAGFSMGGQIAYEMARQLLLMGQTVSFLGVFDTVSDNVSDRHLLLGQRIAGRVDRLFNQVIWNAITFIKKPSSEKYDFIAYKMKSIRQRITKNDYELKPEGVSEGKQSELPKYLHKVHQANFEALDRYILPQYPGKMHLFRALDHTFYIKDPIAYGWPEYVKGGVVIMDIPGSHSRIFAPPNDKIFAEALQKCLDEINTIS